MRLPLVLGFKCVPAPEARMRLRRNSPQGGLREGGRAGRAAPPARAQRRGEGRAGGGAARGRHPGGLQGQSHAGLQLGGGRAQ